MDLLMTRMRDGYSTLLLRRRSNATSRSAGGTHLLHLETMRYALYRESIAFLMADDELSVPRPGAN